MVEESYTKIFKSIDSIIFDRGRFIHENRDIFYCKALRQADSLIQTISSKKKLLYFITI